MPYIFELRGIQSFRITNKTQIPTSYLRKASDLALHHDPYFRSIPSKKNLNFTFDHDPNQATNLISNSTPKHQSVKDTQSRDSAYPDASQVNIHIHKNHQDISKWTDDDHASLLKSLSHETFEHGVRGWAAGSKIKSYQEPMSPHLSMNKLSANSKYRYGNLGGSELSSNYKNTPFYHQVHNQIKTEHQSSIDILKHHLKRIGY